MVPDEKILHLLLKSDFLPQKVYQKAAFIARHYQIEKAF